MPDPTPVLHAVLVSQGTIVKPEMHIYEDRRDDQLKVKSQNDVRKQQIIEKKCSHVVVFSSFWKLIVPFSRFRRTLFSNERRSFVICSRTRSLGEHPLKNRANVAVDV